MSRIVPGKPDETGATPLYIPDDVRIGNPTPVREPSLASPQFDPFNEFKTEPDKFHYRGLNTRKQNMAVRKAEGYEVIPESEFGDLVLGKIPLDLHKRREQAEEVKTKRSTKAAVDQFKQEAAQLKVKTFEE